MEDTKTWKNSFIFTGEEPITKVNSGGGSKNRVIEIAIDGPLIEDGHYVSSVVQEHYGYAGRKFVEYIQETDLNRITERYREIFEQLCKGIRPAAYVEPHQAAGESLLPPPWNVAQR